MIFIVKSNLFIIVTAFSPFDTPKSAILPRGHTMKLRVHEKFRRRPG